MRRLLLAVGCDKYDVLQPLSGAEKDAMCLGQLLAAPNGDYDSACVVRSPTIEGLRAQLAQLPFGANDIESLTFFFAGHGGTKSGTYYLCTRDADPNRLSTTSLSVTELLSVITELKPLQANVLIDACESGSAMLDSAALLRADALGLGTSASMSIAFLAACGPREYASETAEGGTLTQLVLRYLRGDEVLQSTRPALDLIDLGRRVSAELSTVAAQQVPVSWGINLTGEGRFARNPHFVPATAALSDVTKVASVLGASSGEGTAKAVIQAHAFALWKEHRDIEHEVSIPSLRAALAALVTDLGNDNSGIARALRGLATSLRASAVKSADVFAEPVVLYTCSEPLLGRLQHAQCAEIAGQLLQEAGQALAQARQWLLANLKDDRYSLLTDGNGVADLFYLPLRLSRILGWLGIGLEVDRLLERTDASADAEFAEIASLLFEHYAASLVPRSDEQAPFVLVFYDAARRRAWTDLIDQLLGCYFGGFIEVKGVIAQSDASPEDAFSYVLSLSHSPEKVGHRVRANPTQFIAVLLLVGALQHFDDHWDPELKQLDHHAGNIFVPKNYTGFGADLIDEGQNFSFQIGLDIWTIGDFRELITSRVEPAVSAACTELSPLAASLALVASCLQPDRLPLHILNLTR